MKKLICTFIRSLLLFTSCSTGNNYATNSDSEIRNSSRQSSSHVVVTEQEETDSQTEYTVVAISPDGKYSVCYSERDAYAYAYSILNNSTKEYLDIGTYFYPEIEFISQDKFTLISEDYCIFNVNGEAEYRLSDYFPIGQTDDGRDIILLDVLKLENGDLLIEFFDRNETVRPEKEYNSGTLNEPHIYYIGVLSADNQIEKIINTGKNVESSKSLYVSPVMEMYDENTLVLYIDYWGDENIPRAFEIYVNVLTGECKTIDYRPQV